MSRNCRKRYPGYSGGRSPGRGTVEKGREEGKMKEKRRTKNGRKAGKKATTWHWEEEQHLEGVERKKDGKEAPWKLVAMQKVPEVVVNERVSQGKSVKKKPQKIRRKYQDGPLKKCRKGQTSLWREDTEEMKKWRDLNQSEIDTCWKKLAERMEEEVLDKYKVEESKREAFRGRG